MYVGVVKEEPRLMRTATLLNPDPVLGLQIQRMIREAGNPERRAFRDPEELGLNLTERIRPRCWSGAAVGRHRRARPSASVWAFDQDDQPASKPKVAGLQPPKKALTSDMVGEPVPLLPVRTPCFFTK